MIKDESLLERLAEMAKTVNGRYKIAAAVLDKQGNVLSTAVNSYTKTHPKQLHYAKRVGRDQKAYLHAEIRALIKAKGNPYKIVVVRVGHSGELRMAKPCPVCMCAIEDAGIKLIEHTL